jgi:hypothetical protein
VPSLPLHIPAGFLFLLESMGVFKVKKKQILPRVKEFFCCFLKELKQN